MTIKQELIEKELANIEELLETVNSSSEYIYLLKRREELKQEEIQDGS